MRRAYCLIRSQPWYRAQAFVAGLRAAGYEVSTAVPDNVRPGDVLLQWNRYAVNHDQANRFEAAGGTVLVAENGYIGRDGVAPKFDVHPKGPQPESYYALGLGFHNDHARVLLGPERAPPLELQPWRRGGEHILVCPNRSFGVGNRIMPLDWAERCAERLRKQTRRPVRVRRHPGNDAPQRPLVADLAGAWAVVVWSSSCAAHALAAGIPTYIEAPHQILKPASASGPVDDPVCPEREPHFAVMARGQFMVREIEAGEPFHLLHPAGQSEIAACA